MTRLVWFKPEDRRYEAGLDRGVLYPRGAPAVPWNGLIGLEEKSGDAAVVYYQDGRPFLHVPPPKEFAGTLTAFTYPDAFAEIMGEVEAVDGMFIDSQQIDSFDLSYRTMVGHVTGRPYYKIHLVYNVTAVPSARNNATISDSVTPQEFSWDIQAVPVPIIGFRPSAHIIISTQFMSDEDIAELEALLYGDGVTEAAIPEAQTLLDLLDFGDMIIITDHFDGTWSAEGSYRNVYMIGDGIFQIDNVDAIHHGDGTYTINGSAGPPDPFGGLLLATGPYAEYTSTEPTFVGTADTVLGDSNDGTYLVMNQDTGYFNYGLDVLPADVNPASYKLVLRMMSNALDTVDTVVAELSVFLSTTNANSADEIAGFSDGSGAGYNFTVPSSVFTGGVPVNVEVPLSLSAWSPTTLADVTAALKDGAFLAFNDLAWVDGDTPPVLRIYSATIVCGDVVVSGDTIEEPIEDVFGEGTEEPPDPTDLVDEPIEDIL